MIEIDCRKCINADLEADCCKLYGNNPDTAVRECAADEFVNNWEVSRTSTTKIDKDAMKADGILAKYTTTEDSYRISPKALKEGA